MASPEVYKEESVTEFTVRAVAAGIGLGTACRPLGR